MIIDSAWYIGFAAFVGYFIESVFGFGGTVIFVGLAGAALDIKTVIFISVYVSSVASLTILLQAWRAVAWRHLGQIFLLAAPGMVIGTLLIDMLNSIVLLKIFAVLLVAYGLQGLLAPAFQPPRWMRGAFVAIGGVMQGLFSTGGPFVLMGYKDNFINKGQLRATMAAFFLFANLWRFAQGGMTGSAMGVSITEYLWLGIPVVVAVLAGHIIHIRIPEQHFKKGVLVILTLVGVGYLFR
jgi:uncharacterized membrane protein YfcA